MVCNFCVPACGYQITCYSFPNVRVLVTPQITGRAFAWKDVLVRLCTVLLKGGRVLTAREMGLGLSLLCPAPLTRVGEENDDVPVIRVVFLCVSSNGIGHVGKNERVLGGTLQTRKLLKSAPGMVLETICSQEKESLLTYLTSETSGDEITSLPRLQQSFILFF